MSLRQLYLRSRSARKAATHLDYAYPPRHGTSPRACPADCRTSPAPRPMMFWQPRWNIWKCGRRDTQACGLSRTLSARARRHHVRSGARDPTSGLAAALSEPRRGTPGRFFAGICAGGKKQESHWASQRQRLAYLMRVDWPAQPYMKPAQTI
jgi:hypothetical protein